MQGRRGNRRSRDPPRALHSRDVAALQRCNHQRGVGCGPPPHAEPAIDGERQRHGGGLIYVMAFARGCPGRQSGSSAPLFSRAGRKPGEHDIREAFPCRSACGPARFFGATVKPRSRFSSATLRMGGFKRPPDNLTTRSVAYPAWSWPLSSSMSNHVRASA